VTVPNGWLNQDAATWLGCLDRIIACAEGIAETARINPTEDAEQLAACLLARSISTARAVVRLIRLDHVVEARMLTRSIFENAFYLYRLAQDGSAFADEMKADEILHHRALSRVLDKAIEATGREVSSRMREIINRSLQQSPKGKALNPKELISGGLIKDAYVFYKHLSFDAGHPSITALKRHFVESAGNKGFSLEPQLEDGEATTTFFYASMALLIGCITANNALGRTTGGEQLEGLVEEFNKEFNKIMARALPASAPSRGGAES
jgi:hypothetical protein